MSDIRKAINTHSESKRRRARAPEYDLVRRNFELGLAQSIEMDVQELLMPLQALQTGLGGEIVLRAENGPPGRELTLKGPDLLSLRVSAGVKIETVLLQLRMFQSTASTKTTNIK